KIAYQRQLAQQAPVFVQQVLDAPLPPPPQLLLVGQPPPAPIVAYNSRPPDFGGLVAADLQALPPSGSIMVDADHDGPDKNRLLQISISLGDNLFRRGRFKEAQKHFELA